MEPEEALQEGIVALTKVEGMSSVIRLCETKEDILFVLNEMYDTLEEARLKLEV